MTNYFLAHLKSIYVKWHSVMRKTHNFYTIFIVQFL